MSVVDQEAMCFNDDKVTHHKEQCHVTVGTSLLIWPVLT